MDTKRTLPATAGTFSAVLDEYEASPTFTKNRATTQANYRRILRWAHDALGALPVDVIKPSLVQYALDKLADKPAAQFNARAVLGAVDRWAAVRDKLPREITKGTEAIGSDGGCEPWTDAQVQLAERHARPDLARIVTIAVHTGQRGSDVVRMRLTDIDERIDPATRERMAGIHVVQQKTGKRLWVPLTTTLAAKIAEWRPTIRPPWLLVTRPSGEPYTRPLLSWHWNDERATNPHLAPLLEAKLKLHGLRATCVVRLRQRGASVLQICSMVGMSEPMVSRYSRLADQGDMAMAAVHYLNAGTRGERKPSAEAVQ